MQIAHGRQDSSDDSGGRNGSDDGGEQTGRIARNTAFALATQLATSAFTAATTLFLVRALNPHDFGVFSVALAFAGVLSVPADFGVAAATARFVAERRHDRQAVAAVLVDALKLKLVGSAVVSGTLLAAAGPIARAYGIPGLTWPLRAVGLALFGQGLLLLFTYALNAQGRTPGSLAITIAESACETGATIALVLLGGGAAGAAFGRATGYLVGAVIAVLLVLRLHGLPARRGERESHVRAIALYAGTALLVNAAYTLFEQIDVLLIGAMKDARAAGLFQAPLRLIVFLQYPAAAFGSAAAPRLSRGAGQVPDERLFAQTIRRVALLQAALVPATVVWARPILHVVSPDYVGATNVLRALAPFVYLTGFALLFSLGANYLGEVRRRVPATIATVLVNLVLDIVLIPRIGIVAGAIGSDIAFALFVPLHLWICLKYVRLPARSLLLSLARTLLAATAMGLVMLAFGTSTLSVADWILGGAASIAAFALVLVASGEVPPRDVAALLARVRR